MTAPLVSVLVVVFDMQRQAMNTLRSLALSYQQGVDAGLYEVVVVENRSPRTLDPAAIAGLGPNLRYFQREEAGVSPAGAISRAVAEARGEVLCLMIDGARMLTPGVLQHAAMACRITEDALVTVPGYYLGAHPHHMSGEVGHGEETELGLLARIGWPGDGYRLFEVASLSGANSHGFLSPIMESNCLFVHRRHLERIGRDYERFQLPGGGAMNLYLYHRLALLPETTLFVLPGEGSFHQVHGGVTTSSLASLERVREVQLAELEAMVGAPFRAPRIAPVLLGPVRGAALDYLRISAERELARERRHGAKGLAAFADEAQKRPLINGAPPIRIRPEA